MTKYVVFQFPGGEKIPVKSLITPKKYVAYQKAERLKAQGIKCSVVPVINGKTKK